MYTRFRSKQAVAPSARGRFVQIVQLIGTIVLTALLLRTVQWDNLSNVLGNLRWEYIIASFSILLGCHAINALRWQYLTREPLLPYTTFLIYYGAGLFSNNFLPTGIGGDAVRAALLNRHLSLGRAAFAVTIDRGIGLIALSVLFLLGFWFGAPPGLDPFGAWAQLTRGNSAALLIAVLGCLLAASVVALFAWKRTSILQTTLKRWSLTFALPIADISSPWEWARHARVFAIGYGYSAISNISLAAAYWATLQAVGVVAPAGAALWLVIFVTLSLLAPVTINGLGLQESVFVVVLSHYGVITSQALGVALVVRLSALACSLLGGLIGLAWRVPIDVSHTTFGGKTHEV